MGEYLVPIIVGVASTALSAGSSAVTAHQQEVKQHEETRKARAANAALYASTSKPSQEYLEAAAEQNRGQLGQARLSAYQNLASNLSARGWGSGSGLGTQKASEIESGYLQSLGQMNTELTKFGATPFYSPPANMFGTGTGTGISSTGAAVQGGSNTLGQAMGYLMMQNLYGGGGGNIPINASQYGVNNALYNWPTY